MRRPAWLIAIPLISGLIAVPVAMAGERNAAESAARHAASTYVEQFGIYYTPDMWKANCKRKRSSWQCEVQSQPTQCSGKLRLQSRGVAGFGPTTSASGVPTDGVVRWPRSDYPIA